MYRSPNSTRENDDKLCKWVQELVGTNVIIGDFNFPDISWEDGRAGAKGRPFYDAISDRFMQQYVEEGTHISGNILDLVICNAEGMVDKTWCKDAINLSFTKEKLKTEGVKKCVIDTVFSSCGLVH